MTEKEPKRNKISYWTPIFSMTTVLFLTGFLAIFISLAKNTSDVLKESVTIQVELVDTTIETYSAFQDELSQIYEIRRIKFISKDSAAAKLKKEISEDFINVIGYNPLYNSLEINLKSQFFTPKVLERIKKQVLKNSLVRDASYPSVVSESLERNLKRITLFLAAGVILLLLIAVILIDSTIKLAMYSDRFLIKSMQYVGATRWFIIKPYLGRSIINGIISAILACGLLLTILHFFSKYTELIDISHEIKSISVIFFGLFLLGIIISTISTFFAVDKYLNSKLDSLY